jgi:hypothetical protein
MTDALPRLSDTLGAMLDGADPEAPGLWIGSVRLDLPLELLTRRDAGGLHLVGAPTDQHYRTSIMPVLHRLHLNVRFLDETSQEEDPGD